MIPTETQPSAPPGDRFAAALRGFGPLGILAIAVIGASTMKLPVLGALLLASAHYAGQGLAGVQQAAVTGLVFGAIFAVTGRLWMAMCAHAAFDLTAVAIIYWNVEARGAHLIFK